MLGPPPEKHVDSPHLSSEMLKIAYICVRMLKQAKAVIQWESCDLSGETKGEGLVAGVGFEPTTSGL